MKVVLDSKGLVLSPGELTRAPGSLIQADNVNVEAPGVIRSRQGFAKQTNGFGGPAWKFCSTKQLGDNLLMNFGTGTAATGLRYGDGSASTTLVTGTFTNAAATRMQAAVGKKNHYLTTDEGVRRIESDMAPYFAGMPKALGLDLTGPTSVLVGTPGFVLADTESCAYRHTWCKADADGIVMESAPSGRTVVYNNTRTTGYSSTVTKSVTTRILLPQLNGEAGGGAAPGSKPLTTSYFYRLYRTRAEVLGVSPSEDYNIVAEAYLSAGNITAGYVDVTDATPEAFRALGLALYTNHKLGGDGGGIKGANNPPPRARDVGLFADCMFYSDLTYRNAMEFTLLSTVASTGLTAADTLTIGGVVYTAIAPGTPNDNEFVVSTVAAGSSQSEALERTALSLVEAINKSTTNTTVYAFYVASDVGLPGVIRIEARTANASAFTATASAHGTAFRPTLTAVVSSTADVYPNGLAYSKPSQPDAVPAVSLLRVGRADTSMLRQIILQDSIFLFTDSGLYRLIGRSAADFAIQEFDLSFRLIGREMVVACDDAIYAWGYEGIARITSGGLEYISNAIEPLLWDNINTLGLSWLSSYAWAAAYRSKHKVIFSLPTSATDKNCGQALVYDTRMQAWTRWLYAAGVDANRTTGHSCGAVRVSDDLLFMGQWNTISSDSKIFKERRTYAAADYKDDSYDATDLAITKTVKWSAIAEAPQMETHWDELHVFWDVSSTFTAWTTPTAASLIFRGDNGTETATLTPTAAEKMSRCLVGRTARRGARLTVTVAHSTVSQYFGLEGMALVSAPSEGTATTKT